ncbi:group II intron maturase-specific domain-containing protein [Streptomyces sp. NPDC020766]|uniref:group II intron maturase-specific domain-containing protein n=1 Tax=Streptomyces sp. NPDC020766 TaxID=3155011 RepID=UPI0033C863F6
MSGTKADAEALKEEAAQVLSTMGLRLSPEKTLVTHIDEGLDFLGWRIQRHRKRGANKHYVYTYPSCKALAAVMAKVRAQCRRTGTDVPFDTLLICLNRMLRGWSAYFRPGVSSATFQYLSSYAWGRVIWWLRRKHPPDELERPAPPLLRRRLVAGQRGTGTVQPGEGAHHPLSLPRISHPLSMAGRGMKATLKSLPGLAERPLR